jgi:ABC-type dipeptide/oligopeptide/nickel transport system permease component
VGRYALRRVLLIVPTVAGISLLAFAVAHLAPGDAAAERFRRIEGRSPSPAELEAERHALGFDKPLVQQYLSWVNDARQFDLGTSISTDRPVHDELRQRIPPTLQLTVLAALLAVLVAIPMCIVAAVFHNRPADHLLRFASLAGASVPSFWLAFLLVDVFAVRNSLLPVAGRGGGANLVLPCVTLALIPAALLARFTRAALLETLTDDYVRTARAKGLAGWLVVGKHALRTASIPLVTAFGTSLGGLIAGAVVIETVFAWPGMGTLAVQAILQRDYAVIQGVVLYAGLAFAVVNLLVDLSYVLIDPRVRLGLEGER